MSNQMQVKKSFEVHDECFLTIPKKYAGSAVFVDKVMIAWFDNRYEADCLARTLNRIMDSYL